MEVELPKLKKDYNSPFIVKYIDDIVERDKVYIILEYCSDNLENIIERRINDNKPYSVDVCIYFFFPFKLIVYYFVLRSYIL